MRIIIGMKIHQTDLNILQLRPWVNDRAYSHNYTKVVG